MRCIIQKFCEDVGVELSKRTLVSLGAHKLSPRTVCFCPFLSACEPFHPHMCAWISPHQHPHKISELRFSYFLVINQNSLQILWHFRLPYAISHKHLKSLVLVCFLGIAMTPHNLLNITGCTHIGQGMTLSRWL